MMPRWIPLGLLVAAVLALVPFACVARSRSVRFSIPRMHLVQDMDFQQSYRPQERNPLFADQRAMRPPVEGTVAFGSLQEDERYWRGVDGNAWATRFPVPVSRGLLERGQRRYDIYCAPCHGLAGYGDGPVSLRADERQQGMWVPPSSFHTEPVIDRPVGHLFNTITHGIRNMPAYGPQIPVVDRWAIVGYVRALQISQSAVLAELPPQVRAELEARPLAPEPVEEPPPAAPAADAAPPATGAEVGR